MVKAAVLPEPIAELLDLPTDPAEAERARVRRANYDRNWVWFQSEIVALGERVFGRYVGVAGLQAFTADTPAAALAAATAAHPDDDGRFVYYFPHHRLARVHAHTR